MTVITKRFFIEILVSTFFILLGLVGLFAFFELIGQLGHVGKNRTLTEAFILTGLIIPLRIYQVMPLAALLGGVYTFSHWSSTSEFTVLRASGLSPQRLVGMIMLPALLLVGLTYFFGEVVAPPAERYSLELKTLAYKSDAITPRGYRSGVWLRDVVHEGEANRRTRFINVKYVKADSQLETGPWQLFEYDEEGRLVREMRAESAAYDKDAGWVLADTVSLTYPVWNAQSDSVTGSIERTEQKSYPLDSKLGPNIFGVLTTRPDEMSMLDLRRYITHLKNNQQVTDKEEIAFWRKAFYPFATLVMLALALPFAYMNARAGGTSIRIFGGIMIGIVFYVLNNVFTYLGALTSVSPIIMSMMPTVTMLFVAAFAIYRVERR